MLSFAATQTTLVKHILTERHGYRIAVILNEYGDESGIESAFVQDTKVSMQSTSWDVHPAERIVHSVHNKTTSSKHL